MIEVALAAIVVLGFLLWRKERQHEAVLVAWHTERDGWARERQLLLNRIQAPDTAIAQTLDVEELPKGLPFDDDVAFHEARKG